MDTADFDIEQLSFAEYNPRTITADELDKLKKGLKEFGCVQPIVANLAHKTPDGKYVIVGGHQRVTAAKELGWDTIPTTFINEPDLKREKALNLALNKISGSWDFGRLSDILGELGEGDGFDVELSGFSIFEADELTKITDGLANSFFEEGASTGTPMAPDEFPSFDDDIHTDYACPKCAYSWSGKPK